MVDVSRRETLPEWKREKVKCRLGFHIPTYPFFLIAQGLKAVVNGLNLSFKNFSQYLGHQLPLEMSKPKPVANFPPRVKN